MCCRSAPEKAANAHPNVLAASKRFSCNARVQQTLAQRKLHGVLVSSLASPSLLIAQRAGDGATSDLKDNQHWMVAQQDRSMTFDVGSSISRRPIAMEWGLTPTT